MFDVIWLSIQRKFLSRKRCQEAQEVGRLVAEILSKDVVGSVSIKRVIPKE